MEAIQHQWNRVRNVQRERMPTRISRKNAHLASEDLSVWVAQRRKRLWTSMSTTGIHVLLGISARKQVIRQSRVRLERISRKKALETIRIAFYVLLERIK